MKKYLLDTSALLTLRDDEPGAQRVAELLALAQNRKCECSGCFMSQMEMMYRVWRDESEGKANLAYQQCLALPITWIHETPELLKAAASIKARHPLSVANAWIAASTELAGATLVHKDPEFSAADIEQEILPSKAKKTNR